MLLVNSLAIGDANRAMDVEGWNQRLIRDTAHNKKRLSNLKCFEKRRGDPLKGFGEFDFLVATDAARAVAPV